MTKMTKALQISPKVKRIVWERDNGACIICKGTPEGPHCHYIRRSQGGLGIEQNIVTLCQYHHDRLDGRAEPEKQGYYKDLVKEYLDVHYPNFRDEQRIYQK